MPKPYEFRSEAELMDMLRDTSTKTLALAFFSTESPSITDVVTNGIAGNTFRAFRKLKVRPSVTFRMWAKHHIEKTIEQLNHLSNRSDYTNYVHNATLTLERHWREETGSEMGYGRGAKLINLVLKKYVCLQSLSAKQRHILISLLHVPLDSYTIVGLRSVFPELKIPKSATMRYIETQSQYRTFQDKIIGITKKVDVPAIYYDILAWNKIHGD